MYCIHYTHHLLQYYKPPPHHRGGRKNLYTTTIPQTTPTPHGGQEGGNPLLPLPIVSSPKSFQKRVRGKGLFRFCNVSGRRQDLLQVLHQFTFTISWAEFGLALFLAPPGLCLEGFWFQYPLILHLVSVHVCVLEQPKRFTLFTRRVPFVPDMNLCPAPARTSCSRWLRFLRSQKTKKIQHPTEDQRQPRLSTLGVATSNSRSSSLGLSELCLFREGQKVERLVWPSLLKARMGI